MTYEYHTKLTSRNQSGRREQKITSITIHHWGDPSHFGDEPNDGDPEAVARYLCRKDGSSSAHYVVTAGQVWCIVDPDNIAWHAGDFAVNKVSIGIECDPDAQPGTYETVAELIAELRAHYGDLPLYPHRKWQATACPGVWDPDKLDQMARAITVTDNLGGGGQGGGLSKQPAPARKIDIRRLQAAVRTWTDNMWGPNTDKHVKAVRGASLWAGQRFPSGVAFAQVCVGARPDGVWGPRSRKAHDRTVKKVQKALRRLGLYPGEIDGVYGPLTNKGIKLARIKSRA
jgi:hypothetical protein